MSSRSATSAIAILSLAGVVLAGCSDTYFDRRQHISLSTGEASAANRVTHVIDPWPPASSRRAIAYNGEKAQVAAERYRTGRTIAPVNATTSSAAYSQAAQAAQSASNTQAASAPANKP